jgi:hypothetical protein
MGESVEHRRYPVEQLIGWLDAAGLDVAPCTGELQSGARFLGAPRCGVEPRPGVSWVASLRFPEIQDDAAGGLAHLLGQPAVVSRHR